MSPVSLVLVLEPTSMLAASFANDASHDTVEQYSEEKQFDADFNNEDEWEW